jgi:hypothetical protein
MKMMSDFPSIHLYSQYSEHDEAFIIGTRDALIALREAIDAALEAQKATAVVYARDGEGYDLIVQCVSEDYMEIARLPYQYLYVNSHLMGNTK